MLAVGLIVALPSTSQLDSELYRSSKHNSNHSSTIALSITLIIALPSHLLGHEGRNGGGYNVGEEHLGL